MGKYVTMGAVLQCSFGMTPSSLMVIVPTRPKIQNLLVATITDFAPMTNILPFGMCQSMSNPTVVSATAAAMGVLTPMPCVPVCTAPWSPGGKQSVMGMPVLSDSSKLICAWGGNITIKSAGHTAMAEGK